MPKMKTHKGIKRRIRLTASGKLRYKRSFAGHLMSGKSGKRVRAARRPSFLSGSVAKRVRQALGK
ncbi:MAG TPA: 50S ribosomal protein L35 [Phycisphaerae bacterium]|nr:50S ribosomal protein L35 [Phycisphaerae bacterium]